MKLLRANHLSAWLRRWGFGLLVSVAAVGACWAGIDTTVPLPVPDFALRAMAVYRLEVAAAVFAGLYVIGMALVLALNNRAFTEFGRAGVSASDIAFSEETVSLQRLEDGVEILRKANADKRSQQS